ncbi:UDP-2,3-diacylglucosamine diphosphatase [Xylella taiwanensis]|uniref:UDP-2,3-diacylglucosamine hydrolase n=1 Tax=Xylella taiwanensis TaxID=1444770 RepID=Z9JIP9_9GAMM|nr:UDP-2,3-diacylglucosamine diphosphatase [Xylella taiwanensis]AXI84279.1 UDP-2,3-diacylglucosamine hydrolase [Xylella taiwanensis]EWS77711.1 UDP-2,3-diacylglucosamine hydrolase [Xylella taiwanensis]MCD8457395.1 UDP-2,3-diacylglucosamine diphosphatase [Xylella taiwanensis]MCD8457553.1 UDP-2,3-diacylglucosamine diphosphatase [Xylella taiwanensis]MCD8461323.1 UDP-2,3-diacylglucosamine diphosphatase [Xylella taiwanensis]
MTTLIISDLHLDPLRPTVTELFLRFLREQVSGADALYILGDLFEVWIGDDMPSEVANVVAAVLRIQADMGTPLYFIPGNRDFLVGAGYAARAGFRILPDPCVVDLYGEPTVLLHGDLLCTDDITYQAFRTQTRNPEFIAQFLVQALSVRAAFAQQARMASHAHQSGLKQENDGMQFEKITDVVAAEVEAMFACYGVDRIIHGHTHRPALHTLQVGERACTRVVLGDWYQQGSVLRVDADGLMLEQLLLSG